MKSLSASLETTLSASQDRLGKMEGGQKELREEVHKMEQEVGAVKAEIQGIMETQGEIQRNVKILEEKGETEEMVARFNAQVCNTSIELIKKDIEARFANISRNDSNGNVTLNIRDTPPEDVTSQPLQLGSFDLIKDIFKEMEEYVYDYDYESEEQSSTTETNDLMEVSSPSSVDPVGSLITETNLMLLQLE